MTSLGESTNVWQVMGENFELDSKFKILEYLGAGAYGVVVSAKDTSSTDSSMVAIKKCKNIFHTRTLAKRTLRELRLLRLFSHPNIVKLKTILQPQDVCTFDGLYVIFEMMETDLAQIIRSPQQLRDQHVQYFTFQILNALKYLHDSKIVHRDLKPRNILINSDCLVKVADFGLARIYTDCSDEEAGDSKVLAMTEYITTRWYRAPEIIVGWHRYTTAIDIWAVGCILGELLGRSPLFPGPDSPRQFEMIIAKLGAPSLKFFEGCRKPAYRQRIMEMRKEASQFDEDFGSEFKCGEGDTGREKEVRWGSLYQQASAQSLDLLGRLLQLLPEKRLGASAALAHPYFQPYASRITPFPSSPSTANLACSPFKSDCNGSEGSFVEARVVEMEFEFETRKLTIEDLREELLREVRIHNTPLETPTCEPETATESPPTVPPSPSSSNLMSPTPIENPPSSASTTSSSHAQKEREMERERPYIAPQPHPHLVPHPISQSQPSQPFLQGQGSRQDEETVTTPQPPSSPPTSSSSTARSGKSSSRVRGELGRGVEEGKQTERGEGAEDKDSDLLGIWRGSSSSSSSLSLSAMPSSSSSKLSTRLQQQRDRGREIWRDEKEGERKGRQEDRGRSNWRRKSSNNHTPTSKPSPSSQPSSSLISTVPSWHSSPQGHVTPRREGKEGRGSLRTTSHDEGDWKEEEVVYDFGRSFHSESANRSSTREEGGAAGRSTRRPSFGSNETKDEERIQLEREPRKKQGSFNYPIPGNSQRARDPGPTKTEVKKSSGIACFSPSEDEEVGSWGGKSEMGSSFRKKTDSCVVS